MLPLVNSSTSSALRNELTDRDLALRNVLVCDPLDFNGTLALDDVRALVYTQALAASDDVYFVWTGHPSGAFVGYYNKGFLAAANGSRALGWVAASSGGRVFSGNARRETRRTPTPSPS